MKAAVNGNNDVDKKSALESSKIETIKNLIFGENISSYNQEFEAIKTDILEKKEELLNIIDETRKELEIALDSLSTDINIRITDLEETMNNKVDDLNSAKVDKKALGDLFIKLGSKISD